MTVTLKLDRSKKFSEVHGDRTPEDPHYRVCYWQDDLPYDAREDLVADDGKTNPWIGSVEGKPIEFFPLYTAARRTKVTAKLERLKNAKRQVEEVVETDEESEATTDPSDDVNLVSWLKGDVDYPQFALLKAAKNRYHRNFTRLRDLVEDLVYDEKLVPEESVAPRLIKMLAPTAA